MSNKAKGSRREREVRDLLREQGYEVTRAGGSLGMFDLVATPVSEDCLKDACGNYLVRYIQVKSNRWPPAAERRRMEEAGIRGCHAREIWRCDDYRGWRVLALMADGWHEVNGTMVLEKVLGRVRPSERN